VKDAAKAHQAKTDAQIFCVDIINASSMPAGLSVGAKQSQITQEELVRNTQELFDAVAPGSRALQNIFPKMPCSSMKRPRHG
jgi:hypothetical protein